MQYSKEVLQRHKVLSMVANWLLTIKQASRELNLSYRHTQRLLKRFLNGDMGLDTLVYKRTNPAWNKLMVALEDEHSRELLGAELVEGDTTWNICSLSVG